jgi:cyclopropane-fatty-acyl-phospholipid synthase
MGDTLSRLLSSVLAPAQAAVENKLSEIANQLGVPFVVVDTSGKSTAIGSGEPRFRVLLKNEKAEKALRRLDTLAIAEAYLDGDLDLEGDLISVMRYKEAFGDPHPLIHFLRRFEPLLVGRQRTNPKWIQLHYDLGNAQTVFDRDYNMYTPGLYRDANDTMESGAERKLAGAFELLNLKAGDKLLDVGSGWGGMMRYACRRGVKFTGISLSNHQVAWCQELIKREKFDAQVNYQDFFTWNPPHQFDAISLMGVVEDLSDYRKVFHTLVHWVKPGGRVYFDFAAERERFGTHSFITKHIWPGTFRMVYLPEFMEAVRESPFELMFVDNDRANYHRWSHLGYHRWIQERESITKQYGERVWRTLHLLTAASTAVMDAKSHEATAFRLSLELPADTDYRFATTRAVKIRDAAQSVYSTARETFMTALEKAGLTPKQPQPSAVRQVAPREGDIPAPRAAAPEREKPATIRGSASRASGSPP